MGLIGWIIGLSIASTVLEHKGKAHAENEAKRQQALEAERKEAEARERERKQIEKQRRLQMELDEYKRQIEEQKRVLKEERRKATPCNFEDGVSEDEFREIVLRHSKKIKRITDIRFKGPFAAFRVMTQSGISDWWFVLDFNDYGHLTGKYQITTNNCDSSIPERVAERISEELRDRYEPKLSPSLDCINQKYCPACGKSISSDSRFCTYCGQKC